MSDNVFNIGSKARNSENAATWTPREALLDVLRQMDSEVDIPEGSKIDACVSVYRIVHQDGAVDIRFRNSAPDMTVSLGMLDVAKHFLMEDGRS